VPPNTAIFLLGLAVGTGLLILGLLLGYWMGRKSAPPEVVDRSQFLAFLKNLSSWTSEFAGDVNKYQTQLQSINDRVQNCDTPPRQEILDVLSQIMQANRQLQERLDNAEQKLDVQTDQISSYLAEARTDGLTGLLNRRAFDKAIDELFAGWTKNERSFSLGLIDIDHFKHVNDTYGHPAGDAVLKHVARLLQTELRESVCVARYGGEEFAVLSTASAEETATALDQLRATIGSVQIKHEDHTISVTLSAGAAQIASDDRLGKLVRRSDEALYAAKSGGRNRVYLHDGQVCRLVTQVATETVFAEAAVTADNGTDVEPATKPPEATTHEQTLDEVESRIQRRFQRIVEEESQRVLQR
jgi:diguanylate cyclase